MIYGASVVAQVTPAERATLISLYDNTGGPGWVRQTKPNSSIRWKDPAGTECSWFGVTCDAGNQRIVSIDLQANNLIGNLPPLDGLASIISIDVGTNRLSGRLPALTPLAALRTFFAYNNRFSGPIPVLMGLDKLTSFSVSTNLLTGSIPEISTLKSLDRFDVSKNQLTGGLPNLVGLSVLTDFNASENKISGPIPSLESLSSLRYFSISDNQITGGIPPIDNLTNLTRFSVSNNQLSGPLPALSSLKNITFFYASNNAFVGPVPSLSGLLLLSEFDISTNQLTGNLPSLTDNTQLKIFNVGFNRIQGTIPSLDSLKILEVIDLSNNALSGSIPSLRPLERIVVIKFNNNQLTQFIPQINFLETLVTFHVHNNLLTGNLPSLYADNRCSATGEGYFAGLPRLTQFNASANQLSGSIPQLTWQRWPIGCGLLLYDNSLISLEEFNVSNNRLTGAIPVIATLRRLSTFLVFDNRLTGNIPALSSLPSLKTVDFSKNQLTGNLPDLTAASSLLGFYASDNQLTGSIPSVGLLSNLVGFDVSNNRLSGSIPPINTLGDLRSFVVEANQLTGTLPNLSGLQSLAFFRAGKNLLTGAIPSFPNLPSLIEFSVPFNSLSGPLPSLSTLKAIRSVIVNDNKLSGLVPAAPPALAVSGSALCPNVFAKTTDSEWDRATGEAPWFSNCLDDPAGPSITGISPDSGSTKGGASVVISGANFTNVSGVFFGSVAASAFTVLNSSQINAVVPPGSPGSVLVVVANPIGTAVSKTPFTYLASVPAVTRFSPRKGPPSGGTVVSVFGTNLSDVRSVQFGSRSALFRIISDSELSATTPASPVGDVAIRLVTSTSEVMSSDLFSFSEDAVLQPRISNISPTVGPISGGTIVEITGANFVNVERVEFGGRVASFRIVSASSIVATTPPSSAGTVPVRVITQGGDAVAPILFSFRDQAQSPRIVRFNPASGVASGGTIVTIDGNNLSKVTNVMFGQNSAKFTIISEQQLTAVSPPSSAGPVPIRVISQDGESTSSSMFTYIGLASLTANRVYGQNDSFSTASVRPPTPTSLSSPSSLSVDYYGNLFVADSGNNRITVYSPRFGTAATRSVTTSMVIPRVGGVTTKTMDRPVSFALNSEFALLAEAGSQQNLPQVASFRMPFDGTNLVSMWSPFQFVSDANRFDLSQASGGVAIDSDSTVYIADVSGVTYWQRNCCFPPIRTYPSSAVVSDSTLKSPAGLALDKDGGLYVADSGNNRVLHFAKGSVKADRVYGQSNFNSSTVMAPSPTTLKGPKAVAVDQSGGIYVADTGNNRVLHYPVGSTTADAVYGQSGSFTSGGWNGTVDSSTLRGPSGVAVGSEGLFVADTGNNRVLHFPFSAIAPSKPTQISGIVHSATFAGGGVAPGEIVTVFGENFGPTALTGLAIDSSGRVSTTLGGTMLLFDGIPAPMVYAVNGQLSAIVPYSVTGKTSTRVQVSDSRYSVPSEAVSVPVLSSVPGLYTANSSGKGQVAMVNQDGSVNGPASPAPRGTVVVFYGTGEGQTVPAGIDGLVNTAVFPAPTLPAKVMIGEREAKLLYFGAAPGFVSGVFQANVVIPSDAPVGVDIPITVVVGNAFSPAGTTMAIR